MEQKKREIDRDELYRKIEGQIREFEERLKALEARASGFKDTARAEIDSQLQALLKKKAELLEKQRQLKISSGEALVILKEGVSKAASDLKTAIDQSIARFK